MTALSHKEEEEEEERRRMHSPCMNSIRMETRTEPPAVKLKIGKHW
jgi:hypothetical protein